jgi:hypothetical protein
MVVIKSAFRRRPGRAALCSCLVVAALISGAVLLMASVSDAHSASSVASVARTATTTEPAPTPASTVPPTTTTGAAPVSPATQPAGTAGANPGSAPGAAVAPSSNAGSSSTPAAAPPPAPTSEIIVCESPIIDQGGVRTGSETVYRATAGTPPPSGCRLG